MWIKKDARFIHFDYKWLHHDALCYNASWCNHLCSFSWDLMQLLLRSIRDRLRLSWSVSRIWSSAFAIVLPSYHFFVPSTRTNISSSGLRDILDRNRRVSPRGVTTSRVLTISLCAPEGWHLIVLEKFNFDDADGRPNSKRRIGIQAKDLTYRSPLSRTSLRPKLPGHGDRYTRVPRSSPSARVQESQNFHIDFSRSR